MSQVYSYQEFRYLMEELFRYPAPIIIIEGRMGTGKTDFALFLAENLLYWNIIDEVATNIRVQHEKFRHISSLAELEAWLKSSKSRKLFILDEAALYVDARNPLSAMNRKFRHFVFLLRKFNAKLIAIAQRSIDMESAVRELCLATITKLSKKYAVITSDLLSEPVELFNIPKTTVKFDTYDIAEFRLFAGAEADDSEEARIFELYRQLKSYQKVAEFLGEGWTKSKVREYVLRYIQRHAGELPSEEPKEESKENETFEQGEDGELRVHNRAERILGGRPAVRMVGKRQKGRNVASGAIKEDRLKENEIEKTGLIKSNSGESSLIKASLIGSSSNGSGLIKSSIKLRKDGRTFGKRSQNDNYGIEYWREVKLDEEA